MLSRWTFGIFEAAILCALFATVQPTPIIHDQYRRQIPCNHPLRLIAPNLFTHCETICSYSDWTSWEITQRQVPIAKSQCPSQYYYVKQRTRQLESAIGDSADCSEVDETEKICEFASNRLPFQQASLAVHKI